MKMVFSDLYLMDRSTLLLALFIILYFIGMAVWHAIIKKKDGSVKLWRILSVVLLALCAVHFVFSSLSGNIGLSVNVFFPFYIGAAAIALWQFTDGFSLFTIDTGETIAVMVEDGSEANKLGINNGTVITKWNGTQIDKAISEADCILGSSGKRGCLSSAENSKREFPLGYAYGR